MIRNLGSFLLLFFVSLLEAGSVHATVDKREVVLGESVLLTITVVGEKYEKMPDIPTIGGVDVLKSQRRHSSNFLYRDGKSIMELTESLTLEFKPLGDTHIPSFRLEVDGKILESEAIDIKLLRSKAEKKPKFLMEMQVNKSTIYLGEPLIVKLYYQEQMGVDVMSFNYPDPNFSDFFTHAIGKEKRYIKKGYTVHELHYLLLAKKVGKHRLEALSVKIAERDIQTGVPKWYKIESKPLEIEVKALPKSYDLLGNYKLDTKIDSQEIKPNKAVNLTLEIKGEGSLEDFEDIHFEMDGVTVYENDAKIETKLVGEVVQSYYTKHYAFISEHPFEIPSVERVAFDYNNKRSYLLKTQSYKIEINRPVKAPETVAKLNTAPLPRSVTTQASVILKRIGLPQELIGHANYLWLFLAFILGVITTILSRSLLPLMATLGQKVRRAISNEPLFEEALITLYPHMTKSKEVEEMVRQLYAHRDNRVIKIDKVRLKKMLAYFEGEKRL